MSRIRSVLWVGRGDALGCGVVADVPAFDLAWARDLEDALALPLSTFDALVLDAGDVRTALTDLRRLRRHRAAPPTLVRIGARDAPRVADLQEAGAGDVILRGSEAHQDLGSAELRERIEKLASQHLSPGRTAASDEGPLPPYLRSIVGQSPAMQSVFALIERATRSSATVLLAGETGTGKELLARGVHQGSARRDRPFLGVNCAAFPDTLLESELFGHVRGAFTGAHRDKQGLFEVADGGTLFLDEVGETSALLQAKLLRVLQEREVRPVGGAQARSTDVRVIAATNRDLQGEVEGGRFREDLYYRLAVFPILVPPLRERREDVRPLVEHFLEAHGRRDDKPGCSIARDALHLLEGYSWPGNVRELENEIHRAVALAEPGETITPPRLSARLLGVLEPVAAAAREGETLKTTIRRVEAWLIRRALDSHDGNRTRTAKRLGLTREGLYKKMTRYGIR